MVFYAKFYPNYENRTDVIFTDHINWFFTNRLPKSWYTANPINISSWQVPLVRFTERWSAVSPCDTMARSKPLFRTPAYIFLSKNFEAQTITAL